MSVFDCCCCVHHSSANHHCVPLELAQALLLCSLHQLFASEPANRQQYLYLMVERVGNVSYASHFFHFPFSPAIRPLSLSFSLMCSSIQPSPNSISINNWAWLSALLPHLLPPPCLSFIYLISSRFTFYINILAWSSLWLYCVHLRKDSYSFLPPSAIPPSTSRNDKLPHFLPFFWPYFYFSLFIALC